MRTLLLEMSAQDTRVMALDHHSLGESDFRPSAVAPVPPELAMDVRILVLAAQWTLAMAMFAGQDTDGVSPVAQRRYRENAK